MKTNKKWQLIADFRPKGHAFYIDCETSDQEYKDWTEGKRPFPKQHVVAIADCSGKYPDQCDDGALYVDFDRKLTWNSIPLTDGTSTPASTEEIFFAAFHLTMETPAYSCKFPEPPRVKKETGR